jgi:twitching motility protein PilT
MGLVKNGLVGYEEARRQATNPDDFALRFSGISGTSDSKWDDFESKPGEAPVPGTASFGQQNLTPQSPPAIGRPVTPSAQTPNARPALTPAIPTPLSRPALGPPKPPPPPAKPAAEGAEAAPDDFQIERF